MTHESDLVYAFFIKCITRGEDVHTDDFIKKLEMLDVTTVQQDGDYLYVKRNGIKAARISVRQSYDFGVYKRIPKRLLNLIVDYAITPVKER